MRRASSVLLGLLLFGAVAAPAAGYYRQAAGVTARVRVAALPSPVRLTPGGAGDTGVRDGAAPAWRVTGARTSLLLERRDPTGAWRAIGPDDADVVVDCGAPDTNQDRTCTARPRTGPTKGIASVDRQRTVTAAAPIRARAVLGTWVSQPSAAVTVPTDPPRVAAPTATPTAAPTATPTPQGEPTGDA